MKTAATPTDSNCDAITFWTECATCAVTTTSWFQYNHVYATKARRSYSLTERTDKLGEDTSS